MESIKGISFSHPSISVQKRLAPLVFLALGILIGLGAILGQHFGLQSYQVNWLVSGSVMLFVASIFSLCLLRQEEVKKAPSETTKTASVQNKGILEEPGPEGLRDSPLFKDSKLKHCSLKLGPKDPRLQLSNSSKPLKNQIIFIGAGPVGIWTAIQIKLLVPDLEIIFLEKHTKYQRTHLLNVSSGAFQGVPTDSPLKGLIKDLKNNPHIRTDVLEERLMQIAEKMGVIFKKNVTVKDPRTLKREYPRAKLIIGSDGAHSTVRKVLFSDKMRVKKELQYVLELKYETVGSPVKLSKNAIYRTLKVMQTIAQDLSGKAKDGKTPHTLRIFIDEPTYNKLKDRATFKKPLNFNDRIPIKVAKYFRLWLNQKKEKGEIRVPHSEKITVTSLGVYESEEVVKEDEDIDHLLLGDAALGVPYFKSLKNGFLAGTKVASLIKKILSKDRKKEAFREYARFMRKLAANEIFTAKLKTTTLETTRSFVKVSGQVPWEVNKFSEKEVRRLTSALF